VAAVRGAAARQPENADAQRRAGEALLALGDLEGAGAAFDRASKLEPGNAAGLVGLAQTAFRRGDTAAGRAARNAALAISPYDPAALALPR
jgi:cytochrome c-type biogenesis protein CcmH/NrfG